MAILPVYSTAGATEKFVEETQFSAVENAAVKARSDATTARADAATALKTARATIAPTADQVEAVLSDAGTEAGARIAPVGVPVESFGAKGDGSDDGAAWRAAISAALTFGGKVTAQPGRTYTIRSLISVPVSEGNSAVLDLGGATLDMAAGGGLWIGVQKPIPFLSTTSSEGVTRGGSSVTVAIASGVKVGDLMQISSPVEWVSGIPLSQMHVVSDVDTSTGQVWVEGRIPGDITPAQISAAGKTGEIAVNFFHPAKRVDVRNITLKSTNRDGADSLVQVAGIRDVLLENIHVERPKRMGVTATYCGNVVWSGGSTREHGYVTKDRGYTSLSSDPQSLAFGYGFLGTHSYSVQVRGLNSYSGWHGSDIAQGVCYASWIDCVAHKDAYGFSTHEGAWVMHVRGCHAIGGLGITCRSPEIVVDSVVLEPSLGIGITGTANMQRVSLTNVTYDGANVSGNAVPFAFSAPGYPAHTMSAAPPIYTIAGLSLTNVTGASTLTARGDVTIGGIMQRGRPDRPSPADSQWRLAASTTGCSLTVDGFTAHGVTSQFVMELKDFARVDAINVNQRGGVGVAGSSALLYVIGTAATAVRAQWCSAPGLAYIIRVNGPTAPVLSWEGCAGKVLGLAPSGASIPLVMGCLTSSTTLTLGGAPAPTVAAGNAVGAGA